jgi:hypothetical protein
MYTALWKILPGPVWVRVVIVVVAALAVLAALAFFVFPWVDTLLTRSVEVG